MKKKNAKQLMLSLKKQIRKGLQSVGLFLFIILFIQIIGINDLLWAQASVENEVADERVINEIEQQRDKNLKLVNSIPTSANDMAKNEQEAHSDEDMALSQIASKLNKDLTPAQIKKMKIHEAVGLALKPLQTLSEEEIFKQLRENTKGTKTEIFFEHFPRTTLFAVRLIKDPHALSDASKILEDRDKLIQFSALMFITLLLGIILKLFLKTKTDKIFRIISFFLLRVVIMFCVRLALIIFYYGDELSSMFSVFIKMFSA